MDEADRASEQSDLMLADAIRRARRELPAGEPGECELCGEWSGRLVRGACAPCRDRHRLP
jgi:hypothetical protein